MLLSALIVEYLSDHPYGVSPGHADQLRYSVSIFRRWLEREPITDDFLKATLNGYIDWLRETYAPDTARSQRGNILCLWRYAAESDRVSTWPVGVRRLRMPAHRPTAWTPQEVYTICDEAARVPGHFRGNMIRRGPNLRAFVLCAWDTAFRLGDLLSLSPADVISGQLTRIQHKTGIPVARRLHEETWLSCACTVADDPTRARLFPQDRRTYQQWMGRLVARSPVRPGSTKWIRRAVSTACESRQTGDGTQMLGHTRADTAVWYLDRAQLDRPFQPPSLRDLCQPSPDPIGGG